MLNDYGQPLMLMEKSTNPISISVNNLSKKYGSFTAVDNLSFHVRQGEVFGFLGPNGAGKTTTIKMLCGLLMPDSGEIKFNGKKSALSPKRIGYCPQENIHWERLSCREQLKFMAAMYKLPCKKMNYNADKLLDSMALADKADWLASKLSGGMKRRLNICLSLVHDPEIIIFDEPEAGLDPQSRSYVREFIRKLTNSKTVILTTHNMDEADRLAQTIAIIDHGKLLAMDSPEKLKRLPGDTDTLEISLPSDSLSKNTAEGLLSSFQDARLSGSTLIIREKGISEQISSVKSLLKKLNIEAEAFTLRRPTLEDVFLNLTGRKLRQ